MHFNIVVLFQNALAHYSVIREAEGIYLAILERYEGDIAQSPPARIVLIKGMRRWTGSFEHPELLNKIGRAIEATLKSESSSSSKGSFT